MKKIITTKLLIIPLFIFCISTYAQVGIGTTTPANTLDINGWVKIGDQAVTPTPSSVEGSMRYNSVSKCMEFYNGTIWQCIGGNKPLMQTFVWDGVDNTNSGSGTISTVDGVSPDPNIDVYTPDPNYTNITTAGYGGGQKSFTVNNVTPGSKILFIVEIALEREKRANLGYNNSYKIAGNGIWTEYKLPSTGERDTTSFFLWGNPTNAALANLTFVFEANQEFGNLKITTLVF